MPPVATQVVTDTFPGDGSGTTDLPAPWVQTPGGVWKVDGPTAVAYANGAAGNAVRDTGSTDHRVLAHLKTPGSQPGVSGVIFGYADEQNYASFEYVWTGTENAWSLYIEANNVGREIKDTNPVAFTGNQDHTFQVDTLDGVVTVTIDGVVWGEPVTLTTAEQAALGTKAGMVSFSGRGNFYDVSLFTLVAETDPEDPEDPDPTTSVPLPVTLEQLKRELNMSNPDQPSDNDPELLLRLAAATRAVEGRTGPLVARVFTERVRSYGGSVLVSKTPLVSVQSVTSLDGTTVDVDSLDADPSGAIEPHQGRLRGRYDVTYTAGRTVVGENLQVAVLIVAAHLWETQRGRSARSRTLGDYDEARSSQDVAMMMAGFALPRRALELIQPDNQTGIA